MGNGNLFSVFSNQTLILMCLGVGKHRVTVEKATNIPSTLRRLPSACQHHPNDSASSEMKMRATKAKTRC